MRFIKKSIYLFLSTIIFWSLSSCGMGNKLESFRAYEGNARDCANLRIYQVMVSAFQDGDSNIGYSSHYGPKGQLTSGDLQGVINSVNYIKSIGCNAIWMTPIFDSSSSNNGDEKLNSTGYYAYDFFDIDPKFGTKEVFKELVKTYHDNGIYVILDGVFGHWNLKGVKKSPTGKLPKRSHGQYEGCDYPESLEFFKEVATYWIKEFDIDGWRLDQCYLAGVSGEGTHTGGHNYWYEIRNAVKEACRDNEADGKEWGTLGYMVGECWDGDSIAIMNKVVKPGKAKGYGLNSNFDFPSRYQLLRALAREEWNTTESFLEDAVDSIYKTPQLKGYEHPDTYLPNMFISNHDVVRFGDLIEWKHGINDDYWNRNKLGLAILAGYTGPITVYYGDEWGCYTSLRPKLVANGNNGFDNGSYSDNSSRTTGKISGFNTNESDLVEYFSTLMKVRSEHEALWNGYTTKIATKDKNFYACKKTDESGTDVVYVLLNNSNKTQSFKIGKTGIDLITETPTEPTVDVPKYSALFILVE